MVLGILQIELAKIAYFCKQMNVQWAIYNI